MKELKNLDCLFNETKEVLSELINSCPFLSKYVFSGGSALALYLCHRKSEDLDFFSYANNFPLEEILHYIKRFNKNIIVNQTSEQIDMLLNGVKVTFFNAAWNFLSPKEVKNFNIATLENIAAMKVHSLFLRAKYRDYYDLYFLVKQGMTIKTIFNESKKILPSITYKLFVTALLYVDDIEDEDINHLQLKENISKEKIRVFFEEILKKS